jgi:hypothetical protein
MTDELRKALDIIEKYGRERGRPMGTSTVDAAYWEGRTKAAEAEIERLLKIIRAAKLLVHGHIDANTPLHDRIKGAI